MDNYDDELEALVRNTAEIQQKRQDTRVEKEGEVQLDGVFKSYAVYDTGLGKNVEQDTPPDKKFNKTKDGNKQYRAQLTTEAQVLSLTVVQGQCERLPNGEDGWRILSKVSYNEKDGENVKQWLLDHYDSFYNGSYTGEFPVGEYIDTEGVLAEYKWVKVYPKSISKVKVNDSDEVIFRKRINGKDSGPYVVSPFTPLRFYKCTASHFVTLKKDEDGTFAPRAYTSFNAKAVELSETHDPSLPVSERLHRMENKDVHNMIPVSELRKGVAVPHTVYFYAGRYKSPIGTPAGVHIFKLPVNKFDDFAATFKDETKAIHTIRLTVFQWRGDPGTHREMYSVKLISREGELWKNYGITDPNHYYRILCATHTIPVHVTADLWKKNVVDSEANSAETINNREELKDLCGVYTYGCKSLTVDYINFYKTGQAHRISKERLLRDFKRFSSTNNTTGEPEITLKPTLENKQNPLNGENPTAVAVFALGNGQVDDPQSKRAKPLYHAYDGDLYEVLEDSVFFVLTSHVMSSDDLAAVQQESKGDALLDEWIEKEKIFYWFFGIRKKHLITTTQSSKKIELQKPQKNEAQKIEVQKKRPTQEEEEEEKAVSSPPPSVTKKHKAISKKK
jgi:hypothetical protein